MGTYLLRPTAVSQKDGIWTTSPGGLTTDAALQAAIFSSGGVIIFDNDATAPLDDSIRFNLGYYLDGSGVETPFNSLPAGFFPTSALLKVLTGVFDVGCTGKLQFDAATESPAFSSSGTQLYAYPGSLGALDLISNGAGIRFIRAGGGGAGSASFDFLRIDGDYSIDTFQYTLSPTGTVAVGDEITVTSDPNSPNPLDLTEMTVKVNGKEVTPTVQTVNLLIFIIPPWVDGDFPVEFIGDGTQFSGSILAATLTVLFTDASGVYVITPGKTNDTVYNNSPVNDDTIDIKFPNPFIKTAYIGG